MPICFVSLVYLYEVGFDKLNELPKKTLNNLLELRKSKIQEMMETQFVLSYYGKISKEDTDEMTPFELKNWFEFLKKQREIEADRSSSQ
jgi:hypothetical protein